MRFIEAQFFNTLAWALRDHASVVSGAYKLSKIQRGVELTEEEKAQGKEPWRDLTEEEKLKNHMGRLTERCRALSEIADHIYEMNKESEDE